MIEIIGRKLIYIATAPASDWVRQPVKGLKTYDAPQMTSGLSLKDNGHGRSTENSLMYFLCNSNSLQNANQLTALFSTTFSDGHGTSVVEGESFRMAIALYAVRKLVGVTWINNDDEYHTPLVYKVRK